jgi:hypothetical protein
MTNLTDNRDKIIEVRDAAAGDFREVQPEKPQVPELMELLATRLGKRTTLKEAAELMEADLGTSEFPQLLRSMLRPILFSSYAGYPSTHQQVVMEERVDQEFITGIEANNLGAAPVVAEGANYPEVTATLDRSVQIQNKKRGFALPITWEMLTYADRQGMIRQLAGDLGQAMSYTEEVDAYTVYSTSGNYVRTSARDNDIGNNTNATQFGPVGLQLAFSTLQTMKDRQSGRYLGIMPDTLIVGPAQSFFAMQLLNSPTMQGAGDTDAMVLYGQGVNNPFRGMIKRIIVSAQFASAGKYYWVLCQGNNAVKKTVVQDIELLDGNTGDWSYKSRKTLTYRVDKVYGVGMWNDRFAYLSTDTSGPTPG